MSASDVALLASLPEQLPAGIDDCTVDAVDFVGVEAFFVSASGVRFGPRRVEHHTTGMTIVRPVEVNAPEPLSAGAMPARTELPEGIMDPDGVVRGFFAVDPALAESLSPVVLRFVVGTDPDDGEPAAYLNGVAGYDAAGAIRFGHCDAEFSNAFTAIAEGTGHSDDVLGMIEEWVRGLGTDVAAEFEAARPDQAAIDAVAREAAFEAADPAVRSVHPRDLPPSLLDQYRVGAIWIDLDDPDPNVVYSVRTETGVSAGVLGSAMGPELAMPVFVFPGDTTVEIAQAPWPQSPGDPVVIARFAVSDFVGGAVVSGPADHPEVELLDRDQAAEYFGADYETLIRNVTS